VVYRFIGFLLFIFSGSLTNASEYPDAGVFEVVKDESELRVLIYPAGLLGSLGHSHVISTNDIDGRIELTNDPATSNVELVISVESFEIDNEALRLEEGEAFEKPVPDKAKRGTRKNMLSEKLLDSGNFSNVIVRSNEWTGALPDILVHGEFTIRDQTKVLAFLASVVTSDDQIVVTGNLTLTHAQLGLKPFTAALGSIRVRDEMEIKFRITSTRLID